MTSELETLPLTRERAEAMLKEGRVKVAVIGLGRIGLPTAAVFARAGAAVTGVDINPQVVETLQEGSCRFADEPGLQELLSDVVKRRKLVATLDLGFLALATGVSQLNTVDLAPGADLVALVKPMSELRLGAPPTDPAQLREARDRAAAGIEGAGINCAFIGV